MLRVDNLNVYYGMIHAIKDISLEVHIILIVFSNISLGNLSSTEL